MLAYLPAIKPDQTLTSWLLLLGRNHGAQPQSFGHLLWPRCSIWTRDFDRTVPNSTLRAISEVTGVGMDALASMTLREMVRRSGHPERIEGRQAGILPVGVFHRLRVAFGQQYCSQCLDHPSPYLRLEWRSEFAVACRVHKTLLKDGCPHCDAPFIPHRNRSLVRGRCHRCLGSLVDQSAVTASPNLLRLQSTIAVMLGHPTTSPIDQAHDVLSGFATSGVEVIDGVRRLCRLRSTLLREGAMKHRRIEWSSLRCVQRAAALELVSTELANWPTAWISWAKGAGLTQNDLEKRFGPWPTWVRAVMAQLPFSKGVTGFHPKRDVAPLRLLRRRAPTLAAYRRGRARLLLCEAMNVRQALA